MQWLPVPSKTHPIYFQIPEGIMVDIPKPTTIVIKGYNKQNVGDMAAKIRSIRKPEPFPVSPNIVNTEFIELLYISNSFVSLELDNSREHIHNI